MSGQFGLRIVAMMIRIASSPFIRYEVRGGGALTEAQSPTRIQSEGVHGEYNSGTGFVMSGNHRSLFDFGHALVSLLHFNLDSRIMIAKRFFEHPAFGWACRAVDAIPVYRKTDPKGAFHAAVAALKGGDSICIMPEGTIHWDEQTPLTLGPFKTGVLRIAQDANVPIVPLALVGGERIWPRGRSLPQLRLFKRRVVVVRIADELFYPDQSLDVRQNTDALREIQLELVRQATADLQALDPSYHPELGHLQSPSRELP